MPVERLDRADEHRRADPVGPGHHVGAAVDAVAEVHVQMPGRAEHHLVAGRAAAERVARRVVFRVRLDLDDAARDDRPLGVTSRQDLVQQVGCDDVGVALEPVARAAVSDAEPRALVGEHRPVRLELEAERLGACSAA